MRMRLCVLLASVVPAVVLLGCGRDPLAGVEVPDQLTLYSVDGRELPPEKVTKTKETFHGQPVLGKVEITDAAKRREIAAALKQGLDRSDGTMAKCFWPRHAIRSVAKGRTIDYVICFECLQLEIYDGDSKRLVPVAREPQPVFDKHLQDAGVPLVPGPAVAIE